MSWQLPQIPRTRLLPAPSGKPCPGCWAVAGKMELSNAAAIADGNVLVGI
jgi:hypothetical protein